MNKQKVGILFGGRSVEHKISIQSATNVTTYIDRSRFDPFPIGITPTGKWFLLDEVSGSIENGQPLGIALDAEQPYFFTLEGDKRVTLDVIFPVLHGTDGEDGSIQGLLKALDIPFVGSGVTGSAVSMSKLLTKKLLQQSGIPVSKFMYFNRSQRNEIDYDAVARELGTPFMVKAAHLGSSVGISKVDHRGAFEEAVNDSFQYDHTLIFEAYIEGRELECAVIGNDPLQVSRPGEIMISQQYAFYTFDAKYVDPDAVQLQIPAKLAKNIEKKIRDLSLSAYQALQCQDFARVDLFLAPNNEIFINEINTIPGFTNSSMFPMMWQEQGLAYKDLITRLIDMALQRYETDKQVVRDFHSTLD